jgi:hypothetical protein
MLTLRSTGLCSVLVLPFLLAACGSDPAAGPGPGPGPGGSTAPTVTSTDPSDTNLGVAINVSPAATFSTAMDPATLTATSFTVKQGTTTVPGVVSYLGSTATFNPTSNLAPGVPFTATVSTGAKDLAGNALAADFVWTFTTGTTPKLGPAPVGLAAGSHVILAKTGISSVSPSALTGDLGISPLRESFVTGFSLTSVTPKVFSSFDASDR